MENSKKEDLKFENFRAQVKEELKNLERDKIIRFGRLCATRALPFLGAGGNFNFWKKEQCQKNLQHIFYAIDLASSNISSVNKPEYNHNDIYKAAGAVKPVNDIAFFVSRAAIRAARAARALRYEAAAYNAATAAYRTVYFFAQTANNFDVDFDFFF